MGHYDSCYEADAERDRQKTNERNGQLRKTAIVALNKIEAHADMFIIANNKRDHLLNKCNELRALIELYTKTRKDNDA